MSGGSSTPVETSRQRSRPDSISNPAGEDADREVGNLIVEPVAASGWLRIAELVAQYNDLPLGTVDASVIAAAERLDTNDVATLDRRRFTVVQSDIGTLNLLP